MSRELTSHAVCNDALKIRVMDEPGSGGACHSYWITVPGRISAIAIEFQNGPIKEVGVNGITHEVLLAILEDRLAGFESGQFACHENETALKYIRAAQALLKLRVNG